jgi:hypothetical protein
VPQIEYHAAGGPPVRAVPAADGITISRIEEGKIVEEWEHYDAMGLMQQLGAHGKAAAPARREDPGPDESNRGF